MDDFCVWDGGPVILNAPEELLTDDLLMRLSALNKGMRMERTGDGRLVMRPPPGLATSARNAHLTAQLGEWNRRDRWGMAFASCMGFRLPNTAVRSPDVSWVSHARWAQLQPEPKDGFPPLSPDFVAELVPAPDERAEIEAKMQEYIANGTRLGWLIDPQGRRVEVYRPGQDVQVLKDAPAVSADPELPGFTLDLTALW